MTDVQEQALTEPVIRAKAIGGEYLYTLREVAYMLENPPPSTWLTTHEARQFRGAANWLRTQGES